jgi:hypothetical protein
MSDTNGADDRTPDEAPDDESTLAAESVGLSIPDDHVGAFVAEVFEDPERSTTWSGAVDAMVPDDAREQWDRLSAGERAKEMLGMATDYDERAVEHLAEIPVDGDVGAADVRDRFDEAVRCRRNADKLRNAIADAYADGTLDDDSMVGAVEANDFDTTRIARREQLLESVAEAHGFEFRPYGGTLVHEDDGDGDGDTPGTDPW